MPHDQLGFAGLIEAMPDGVHDGAADSIADQASAKATDGTQGCALVSPIGRRATSLVQGAIQSHRFRLLHRPCPH